MKILTSIDSFKGSFTSQEANQTVAEVFEKWDLVEKVTSISIADGGEGTIAALTYNLGGKILNIDTFDLVGNPVKAMMGWIKNKEWAIIEVAEAVSVNFLDGTAKTHPNQTNSYGIGVLIKKALDLGAKKIIIGLGGTGTIDLGWGLADALGAQFLSSEGEKLAPYPYNFEKVTRLDTARVDIRIYETQIVLLNDVSNPLLGDKGVVQLFGEQKGLKTTEFEHYEQSARIFANLMEPNGYNTSGDGAAGGIGFMLRTLFDGVYRPGFVFIADVLKLADQVENCDLVITGEGRFDSQSLIGKVPAGMARLSKKAGKSCLVFTGKNELSIEEYQKEGINVVVPIVDQVTTLEEAVNDGLENLKRAAERVLEILKMKTMK